MSSKRTVIAGWPRAGKTTLASEVAEGRTVYHTDDLAHIGWSEASEAAAAWLERPGPWVIEGVAVPRALRKWLAAHPGEPWPFDEVVYLDEPLCPLLKGQAAMGKGCDTVWAELANAKGFGRLLKK